MSLHAGLRVAIISEHASPLGALGGVDAGGQNVYVAQLARQLARSGCTVDVFTRRDRPDQATTVRVMPGYRLIHVPAGPPEFVRKEDLLPYMEEFTAWLSAHWERQQTPYDVIHANFWMSALVGADLKRRFGTPLVVTFHALGRVRRQHQGADDAFPDERFTVEDRVVAEADRIIAECPQDEVDLISLYSADPGRLTMIPCGYDPEECRPVEQREARERLGLPLDVPIVLQLGRMVRRKGVDNVIRGFARLRRDHPDALLVIAGGESDRPDPERTPELGRLMQVARQEGVVDRISFVGAVPRDAIRHYYSAADVFVTTPWYEPFGITPVEAMACGTPVVGARVGGIQYTVRDGETGFLVPPDDPDALGDRIGLILGDRELSRRFSANGLRRTGQLFTWEAVVASVHDLYRQVVEEGARPRAIDARRRESVVQSFDELILALSHSRALLTSDLLTMSRLIGQCFRRGNKLLLCGNGGSAADALHFATELVGRFRIDRRRGLPAIALPADVATLTAWANDVSWDEVFARQVEALGEPGDVLLAISTSGTSANVIRALQQARRQGIQTLALLGRDGGEALPLSASALVVPSHDTQRIQEVHGLLIHVLADLVERDLDGVDAVQAEAAG